MIGVRNVPSPLPASNAAIAAGRVEVQSPASGKHDKPAH